MCSPVWSNVASGSTLEVEVEVTGGATVVGTVLVVDANGEATQSVEPIDHFPLSRPVEAGASYRVTVHAASTGSPGVAVVTSQVTGDSRGPDTCRLVTDAQHPAAIDIITVFGA